MTRPAFHESADLWLVDGSLRDIYVLDARLADWCALIALAREYGHEYSLDGSVQDLPELAVIFEDREHSHLLGVEVGSVKLHCHFFGPDQIELDINPAEVSGPSEHLEVLLFLERLGLATQKDVLVTAENSPESICLRYESTHDRWHVHASPANSDA